MYPSLSLSLLPSQYSDALSFTFDINKYMTGLSNLNPCFPWTLTTTDFEPLGLPNAVADCPHFRRSAPRVLRALRLQISAQSDEPFRRNRRLIVATRGFDSARRFGRARNRSVTSNACISASSGATDSRFREDTRLGVLNTSIESHRTRSSQSRDITRVVVTCQRAE